MSQKKTRKSHAKSRKMSLFFLFLLQWWLSYLGSPLDGAFKKRVNYSMYLVQYLPHKLSLVLVRYSTVGTKSTYDIPVLYGAYTVILMNMYWYNIPGILYEDFVYYFYCVPTCLPEYATKFHRADTVNLNCKVRAVVVLSTLLFDSFCCVPLWCTVFSIEYSVAEPASTIKSTKTEVNKMSRQEHFGFFYMHSYNSSVIQSSVIGREISVDF